MRTLTAVALALTMLVSVTAAHATTTHKKHHKKHQASSADSKGADKGTGSKEKAPATK
jgi:hypothetical protein